MSFLLGIDLGGTKIEAALIDSERPGEPLHRLRVPTGAENGYAHIVDAIVGVASQVVREADVPMPDRIGLGTPGVLDPQSGLLKNSNTQCLNGQPLKRDLEARTGIGFVTANDANCFALAEATLGCARGYETVFGVILGTGVGGGLVVRDRVLNGCHGIAGEWGQNVLDPQGPLSNYGTRGTVEAFIAGPALERFYAGETGTPRSLREIYERAIQGSDLVARRTIARLQDYLAEALTTVINIFDPHAIVFGGGVGNIPELYTAEMREKIAARVFNPTFDAALLKPTLGDSAGVFGAAMLVASAK